MRLFDRATTRNPCLPVRRGAGRAGRVLITVVLLGVAVAAPADERGRAVAVEADARFSGFGSSAVDAKMVLRTASGETSEREFRLLRLDTDTGGDRTITVFDRPYDIRGTALLTHSQHERPDDQWLYLPVIRRVKRISASNRSGPFVGSEFAYEDMSSLEVSKYSYRYLREESLDGVLCHVIERTPTYEGSGYKRQVVWYDQKHYRPQRIQFYDRRNALAKVLRFEAYRAYQDGRYWRPGKMLMSNLQSGKSTDLIWGRYRFGVGLNEADFTRGRLRSIR